MKNAAYRNNFNFGFMPLVDDSQSKVRSERKTFQFGNVEGVHLNAAAK